MKKKTFRDWAIYRLVNSNEFHYQIDYSGYSIIYSALDDIKINISEEEIHIEPESFYFIPPNSRFQVKDNFNSAVIFWFKIDLFVNRLDFLYQIEKGAFFKQPGGLKIKNDFLPYHQLINHYYRPFQEKNINKLLKKNIVINFIEFVLIRSLVESDPTLEESTKNTYEKKIADQFVLLVSNEPCFVFNMNHYSDQMNITKRSLDNAVQAIYGCSAKKFITGKALEKAKIMLRGSAVPIKNISQTIGFSEESNFHNFFKKHTGYTPREFRTNANSTTPEVNFIHL